MRIVKLKEFLEMPEGTIYSEYEPVIVHGLFRKGKSLEINDFFTCNLLDYPQYPDDTNNIDFMYAAGESGESFKLDLEIEGRWGLFDNDATFMVYDASDIDSLISALKGGQQ